MTFIFGAVSATAFWGVVYWLFIHGKLPAIELRIKDFVSAEIDKIRKGTHP